MISGRVIINDAGQSLNHLIDVRLRYQMIAA